MIGNFLLVSVWVVGGLLLGGTLASAKGVTRKQGPGVAMVEVEGELLEYQEKHRWCTYRPGARIHGMGATPWGRFKVTSPPRHAGRSFGVLLKCSDREDLLRTLRSGTGRLFVLVLPRDFLQGKYAEIEDCSIDSTAMKRWRPASATGRP